MNKNRTKKTVWIDVVVIVIVLLIAGFMYSRYNDYRSSVALNPRFIYGPPDVNKIILDRVRNTPIDPDFESTKLISRIKTFGFYAANFLTQLKPIDSIYHFLNRNQGFVHECANDGDFVDSSIPQIRYPLDISKKELNQKIKDYPELLIIDVRDEEKYIKSHIPGSVTMPLLDLVNQIFTVNRWTEVVVVGDSYLQTKLASEALLRLNFQRLHRLIVPVKKSGQQLESFE
jgi:rhodanese-related sulfurtransferase